MALRLKPETRERWRLRVEQQFVTPRSFRGEHTSIELDSPWRPVPRSEPEPPEHTDMFIKGYVD